METMTSESLRLRLISAVQSKKISERARSFKVEITSESRGSESLMKTKMGSRGGKPQGRDVKTAIPRDNKSRARLFESQTESGTSKEEIPDGCLETTAISGNGSRVYYSPPGFEDRSPPPGGGGYTLESDQRSNSPGNIIGYIASSKTVSSSVRRVPCRGWECKRSHAGRAQVPHDFPTGKR